MAFDKAIELQPDYTKAWINKGEILAQLKRYDEAVRAFDAAIEINPNLFEVWYNKGLALYFWVNMKMP